MYVAPLDAWLRGLIVGQLGYYGDMDTIKEAQRRFADHISSRSSLPADLEEPVFSICLANGDSSTFDQLIKVSFCCHLYYLRCIIYLSHLLASRRH